MGTAMCRIGSGSSCFLSKVLVIGIIIRSMILRATG
ncbi:hypothetical protein CCACVL1_28615 [Corchorus capsularis]|uniref:Uncharacterized protein n=1 Tax=Corchorus capsularis TaxID=210143 RepID=A0A1R3G5Z6_COCAP|nr:hypothetical protein CCACVL1_28615 [Corchorus capsularis]